MGTADPGHADVVSAGPASSQLVRMAAALRWTRPDLAAELAELALGSASDVATWAPAVGWLLRTRAAVGDGREPASDLLDVLARSGGAGTELAVGRAGCRLRVELAAVARRGGEPDLARKLLAAEAEPDDAELCADVLTELAHCAVDDGAEEGDDALLVAQQAWQAAGSTPGVASVMLLRAGWDRRAGRADVAAAKAVGGLQLLNAGDRRFDAARSDHLVAALTAEWIAALADAGRVDQARRDALPAAHRLITTGRPSRQVAGLSLAVARIAAASGSAEAVVAALEAAAHDAAHSDVPELESACRSLLGELYEAAGRSDAARAAARAAAVAERRDRDRETRLRCHLAAMGASGAGEPAPHLDERLRAGDPQGTVETETGARRRRRGRSTDADGLGLGELLAGALAAYRSL